MGLKILFVVLFVAALVWMTNSKAGKKKKVVFFGDSITEGGTVGNGFINQIEAIIKSDVAHTEFQLIGAGISGNTVTDLRFRLEKDVLNRSPYATFIYIGINDVWQNPNAAEKNYLDSFEESYRHIIREILRHDSKVVLCTPTVIGEQQSGLNNQDKELDLYAEIVRKLAIEYGLQLVDLRKLFMDYYATANAQNATSGILTTDGVHLNNQGNILIADAFWKVLKAMK
jgi:lysophospholipase L1-like esterase